MSPLRSFRNALCDFPGYTQSLLNTSADCRAAQIIAREPQVWIFGPKCFKNFQAVRVAQIVLRDGAIIYFNV